MPRSLWQIKRIEAGRTATIHDGRVSKLSHVRQASRARAWGAKGATCDNAPGQKDAIRWCRPYHTHRPESFATGPTGRMVAAKDGDPEVVWAF